MVVVVLVVGGTNGTWETNVFTGAWKKKPCISKGHFTFFLEKMSEFNAMWCKRYGSVSQESKVNRFSAHSCFALSKTCRA